MGTEAERKKWREYKRKYYKRDRAAVLKTAYAWRRKNKKKYNATVWRARHRLKAEVYDLLGRTCAKCSETDWRCLQVDHRAGGGCKHKKKVGTDGIYRDVLKHPEKYQILCSNCNQKKKYAENEITYGPIDKQCTFNRRKWRWKKYPS